MFTRICSSAAAGLLVTTALLFMMQFLIATGEGAATEPRPRHLVDWVSPPDLPDSPIVDTVLTKPDPPAAPPPTNYPEPLDSFDAGVLVPNQTPPDGPGKLPIIESGDGPLINIIKVQPQYPAVATTRGLEGTVIVRFDVTELGTVTNAVVVESSNRIFNKSALDAVHRFRYKPGVIDGVPHGAEGLQQLFRFSMEK